MINFNAYKEKIRLSHELLQIPTDYESVYGLSLQMEAKKLTPIENDIFDRPQKLIYPAGIKWKQMKEAANSDGVIIQVISAFRSVDYQIDLIFRKLNKGQKIASILEVNAAPGYSEHHSGKALDLATNNGKHLSEAFENTEAFNWLLENAIKYSFKLSYPRNCKVKICYEPWHWVYINTI